MDQNMNTGTQMPPVSEEKKPIGAITSIVVIVLILAFGAYYFLKQVPEATENQTIPTSSTGADQTTSALSTQGTSTDIADIQKDINATDLSGLDAGISEISIF